MIQIKGIFYIFIGTILLNSNPSVSEDSSQLLTPDVPNTPEEPSSKGNETTVHSHAHMKGKGSWLTVFIVLFLFVTVVVILAVPQIWLKRLREKEGVVRGDSTDPPKESKGSENEGFQLESDVTGKSTYPPESTQL